MIHISDGHFKDEQGRTLLLRGVNLGGSSKVPYTPDGATFRKEGFYNHRQVSFVGRPFPLQEADEHFNRLRAWGLTFLRLLVTWEAVEHAGPGIYDQEYLEYLYAIVRKAGEHGLLLFIDPHQDVWSRFSGGDGAPGWTFEAVGLDLTAFDETGAAFTHQQHSDPLTRMIWPSNSNKLAAATMFTLFFGGEDFAPQLQVDGQSIQSYLQGHYIAAMQQVARCLQGLENVLGYDTLNEPGAGYIGWADLAGSAGELRIGASPTPFQSMLLGAGFPQEVDVSELRPTGAKVVGQHLLNPAGRRAWLAGHECIWRRHGVWDVGQDGQPRLLRPDYFASANGHPVDFNHDYLRPFIIHYARAMREVHPKAMIFIEGQATHAMPAWDAADVANIVAAPHWYDALELLFKDFNPWLGYDLHQRHLVFSPWAVRRSFAAQLRRFQQHARQNMDNAPVVIGEVGIAFDLQGKRAYRTGDFSLQMRALERTMRALDDTLINFTLWNYTADNSNARGDQWNDEDLSIFSRNQQTDPGDIHSGGRALPALVRPYAQKIAGEPFSMSFDYQTRRFELVFRHDPVVSAPTEIFVPDYQYPQGFRVRLSDGAYQHDAQNQLVLYSHSGSQVEHRLRISPP